MTAAEKKFKKIRRPQWECSTFVDVIELQPLRGKIAIPKGNKICSQAENIVHIGRRTKFLPPTRYISDLFLLIFIRPHPGGRGISP